MSYQVSIGGKQPDRIDRLEIQESAFSHGSCEILYPVSPQTIEWEDTARSYLGKNLKVQPEGEDDVVFEGLVTDVSLVDIYVRVIARSRSWLTEQTIRSRTFKEQTAPDILKAVFQAYGITVETAGSMPSYSYESKTQYNESDYHFCLRLAREEGITIFNVGDKIILAAAPYSGDTSTLFLEQTDFRNLELGVRLRPYAQEHLSHNYHGPRDFDTTVTNSDPAPSQSSHKISNDASKGFSEQSLRHGLEYRAAGALEDHAKAQSHYRVSEGCSVSIVVTDPSICIGQTIEITEDSASAGKRNGLLAGKFVVKERKVTHTIGDLHYRSHLTLANSEFFLPPPDVRLNMDRTTFENAVVTSLKDEKKLGRVQLRLPWQEDDGIWARVPQRTGGGDHGHLVVPHVDDEVLVGFEQGDPDKPVVVGATYHDDAKPQKYDDLHKEWIVAYTQNGTLIKIDDRDGEEKNIILCVGDETGASPVCQIKVDKENKDILIKADKTIRILAAKQVFIEGTDLVDIKSTKEVKIMGTKLVDIKSSQKVKITGTQEVKIASTTKVEINGGAQLDMKAAMVKINASAMMELKAPLVKIN